MKIKAPFSINIYSVGGSHKVQAADVLAFRIDEYYYENSFFVPLQELLDVERHPVRRDTDPGSSVDSMDADFG